MSKATVNGDDKVYNRQFAINGTVELIGKKFETNQQIRCGLLNTKDTDGKTLSGFIVRAEYVLIQDNCYDAVKVVDKKISSI